MQKMIVLNSSMNYAFENSENREDVTFESLPSSGDVSPTRIAYDTPHKHKHDDRILLQ